MLVSAEFRTIAPMGRHFVAGYRAFEDIIQESQNFIKRRFHSTHYSCFISYQTSQKIKVGEVLKMTVADEALSNRVRNALASDKRISGLPIEVRVSAGNVFLKGYVENLEQRDVAQFIVSGVPGVRHVNVDELLVRGLDQ